MKIGIALGLLAPKYWNDVALEADRLGFHSLWMPDHLVFPTDMSGSPFPGEDHVDVPPNTKLFDAFGYLCFLAAQTRQIRLGTNVYLLGLRHPFIAARAIQTLDILSGGRAVIGVGAGWLKQEWEVTGMDPATRGKRLDEALVICKRLWTEEKISHHGRFYQFDEVMFEPKPLQKPHPPLYVGGESDAALRRTVLHGNGWLAVQHTPQSIQAPLLKLRELCQQSGRPFQDLHILTQGHLIPGTGRSADEWKSWQDSGVHELILSPWEKGSAAIDGMRRLAEFVR